MTAELARKREKKFDAGLANDCFEWMKLVLSDGGFEEESQTLKKVEASTDVVPPLKDGTLLCKLARCIQSGSVKKFNEGTKMAFKQMENINTFLDACQQIGCAKSDLFQMVDLYESANVNQVVNGIIALGRKAQTIGYNGPVLGPTESTENKREFSEEQLRAGEGIIGLQAGSNKGASQAGQNFGKTRAIID